jgi:hypothetical protein
MAEYCHRVETQLQLINLNLNLNLNLQVTHIFCIAAISVFSLMSKLDNFRFWSSEFRHYKSKISHRLEGLTSHVGLDNFNRSSKIPYAVGGAT